MTALNRFITTLYSTNIIFCRALLVTQEEVEGMVKMVMWDIQEILGPPVLMETKDPKEYRVHLEMLEVLVHP